MGQNILLWVFCGMFGGFFSCFVQQVFLFCYGFSHDVSFFVVFSTGFLRLSTLDFLLVILLLSLWKQGNYRTF